jgi:adenosylhomocysteine nucleosidase
MEHPLLIITALESELTPAALAAHIPIVYSGVGKINATLATYAAIQQYHPKRIVNFGTAGKINTGLSGLVQVKQVVQRDMMTEPLAPRGTVPFSKRPHVFHSPEGDYVCGSGDSFVTQTDPWLLDNRIDLVDMELFAIASVAHLHGIDWLSYKYISDDANENSGTEWESRVNHGEVLFLEKLKGLIYQFGKSGHP